MSRIDPPPCRACGLPTTTPIADLPSGVTTDRYHPHAPEDDGHANVWCGACGVGWIAPPADVAQATRALRAYYKREGYDAGPETAIERAHPIASPARDRKENPNQLNLPIDTTETR